MTKSFSIHKTISREQRASVAWDEVVLLGVGILCAERMVNGEDGFGLPASPLTPIELVVGDAVSVRLSERPVSGSEGGNAGFLVTRLVRW